MKNIIRAASLMCLLALLTSCSQSLTFTILPTGTPAFPPVPIEQYFTPDKPIICYPDSSFTGQASGWLVAQVHYPIVDSYLYGEYQIVHVIRETDPYCWARVPLPNSSNSSQNFASIDFYPATYAACSSDVNLILPYPGGLQVYQGQSYPMLETKDSAQNVTMVRLLVQAHTDCWVPASTGTIGGPYVIDVSPDSGPSPTASATPKSVPSHTPTATASFTPTATFTPTDTPAMLLTFGLPELSTHAFQYQRDCYPNPPSVTIRIALPVTSMNYYVYLFYKVRNLNTEKSSEWKNLTMEAKSVGVYQLNLTWQALTEEVTSLKGATGEIHYQFVATNISGGDQVARSPVYTDLTISPCNP